MNTVIAFIIIFGVLVFVHELGHLVFAKRAGILCREFAIGFGPKVFSFKKQETVYTIRLLPIGGFVRMAGEDPEVIEVKPGYHVGLMFDAKGEVNKVVINNKDKYPDAKIIEVEYADLERELIIRGYELNEEETLKDYKVSKESYFVMDGQEIQNAPFDRQFGSKTLMQRTLAIFAGPMMNFILAFFIFAFLGMVQGYYINEAVIGELAPDGAAQASGLQQGDKVLAINDESVSTWEEVVKIIQVNANEELLFLIERDGQSMNIPVTPKSDKAENGEERGVIGVFMPTEKSFLGAIPNAATETYTWTKEIITGLGKLITGQFSIDMLSGPVGIYKSTEVVAESGIFLLMRWTAVLSINLGIINLLPIPALDGGRLMFFAAEAVRGKPIDRHKEGLVHFIGFALLMLLMLVVTWNDIQKFFL
ncbi:regulator of sigma E protease [Bacillus tianshenii]|uniref:Zinc metalloprotease n=1 Tax=Sutcliffiella tianshenii TaxID=1463404 RepID=A0ABS2NWH4_9BACI|nr:RIP metalloprotease RseP [Bacillus tianshenii]MBM7619021.1 regulator of sigma E protease [Bacillus tianshenii]MCA1320891.1 RIP metalloprotease RseP [Bacillus tianshenii]